MPATTYMVVDPRHDHGFKVPRPDLASRTGAPDACTGCHADQNAAWAAGRIAEWFGPQRRREPTFGEALGADRTGRPDAGPRLVTLAGDQTMPGIARATAVEALEHHLDEPAFAALRKALVDPDPLVRLAAVGTAGGLDPRLRLELVEPLLADPVRAVRLDATRVLAPVPTLDLTPDRRARLDAAFAEYEAAQATLVERPEGLITLANYDRDRGRLAEAEALLRDSVRLHPGFAPAYANLADLLRQQGRDQEGEAVLAQGLDVAPASPDLHHAKGLWLIRQQKYREAVAELGRAAELGPDNAALRLCLCRGAAGDRPARMRSRCSRRRSPTTRRPGPPVHPRGHPAPGGRRRGCAPSRRDAGPGGAGLPQRARAAARGRATKGGRSRDPVDSP